MPKVKYLYNDEYIYEVYGATSYTEKCREYDREWEEINTKLLIYDDDEWIWVDARNYKPYEE